MTISVLLRLVLSNDHKKLEPYNKIRFKFFLKDILKLKLYTNEEIREFMISLKESSDSRDRWDFHCLSKSRQYEAWTNYKYRGFLFSVICYAPPTDKITGLPKKSFNEFKTGLYRRYENTYQVEILKGKAPRERLVLPYRYNSVFYGYVETYCRIRSYKELNCFLDKILKENNLI